MPAARLRIRRRVSPWAVILPVLRFGVTVSLIGLAIFAGWRYISQPLGAGALEFTPHVVGVQTEAKGVRDIAARDMDGDGDVDLLTAGKDGIKVYENNDNFSFTAKLIDDKDAEQVKVADLDGDGDLDLAVALRGSSPSARWYAKTNGLEFTGTALATAGADTKLAVGDINGDSAADIVTASNSGGAIVLERWMNNGSGTFAATTISSDSKVEALVIGDANRNGYKDIVIGGSGGLQRWDTSDGTTWNRTDIDDDNGDKTDIEMGDPNTGVTWIVTADAQVDELALYRSGSGDNASVYGRTALATGLDFKAVTTADLDQDGDLDIVAAAQDNNTVYWYENDGTDGSFAQHTLATNLQSVSAVAVADLDGDEDNDVATNDLMRGTVWAYERLIAKPKATAPSTIAQSTGGSGLVTFKTTLSDGDRDDTRIRVQYSTNGTNWYKPWLTKVSVSEGAADFKNSNGYQVGTANAIDTDDADSVDVTMTWDTKSVQNTGGPIKGDVGSVQLRVIPRDDRSVGVAAISSKFRIDNAAPGGVQALNLASINDSEAVFTWLKAVDSSLVEFKIYYGTDHATVLEQRSEVWDGTDDGTMDDTEATGATITGLTANKLYTFKLFVTDAFGNQVGLPSVRGTTAAASAATPAPTDSPEASPTSSPQATPDVSSAPSEEPTTSPAPTASPSATPFVTLPPSPTPTSISTLTDNQAPLADGGIDQVVNPSALVILDGTASLDADRDSLVYAWRQLAGPSVELVSERTATPSFSAGDESETYIFALTVRDPRGASATDTVTVAVKALPQVSTAPVEIEEGGTPAPEPVSAPFSLTRILDPINIALLALSLLSTAMSLGERVASSLRDRRFLIPGGEVEETAKGKVIHHRTGAPVAGVQVLIYGSDGKLRRVERTNAKGEFSTLFPAGRYTIGIQAEGFVMAGSAGGLARPENAIVYTGGTLTVQDESRPVALAIPLKPTGQEIGAARTRSLHIWQALQRIGRVLSWPIFLAGAILNTFLVFRDPSVMHLVIEVTYVALVIIKVILEVRVRPAYGLVRDAVTHVPLDLSVVRLYEQETNRIIMTRVTNAQGKFFALPPAGNYTITVTKPGYGTFSKPGFEITSEHDSALQLTADLMPVAPVGGLAAARAATL